MTESLALAEDSRSAGGCPLEVCGRRTCHGGRGLGTGWGRGILCITDPAFGHSRTSGFNGNLLTLANSDGTGSRDLHILFLKPVGTLSLSNTYVSHEQIGGSVFELGLRTEKKKKKTPATGALDREPATRPEKIFGSRHRKIPEKIRRKYARKFIN